MRFVAKRVVAGGIARLIVCALLVVASFVTLASSYGHVAAIPGGPADVSTGLELWLSASSGVKATGLVNAVDGQSVVRWDDLSTKARNATPSGSQAVFSDAGLNYNPTLVFTDDNYTASSSGLPASNADRSIFVVASANSGGWRYVLGAGTFGSNNGFDFGHNSSNQSVFITTHNNREANTSSWQPYGAARLAYGSVDAGSLYIAVNGSTPVIGNASGGVNTINDGSLNIGANSGSAEAWDGNISEVIMYDRVVTATERQRINSYLALKYGFSLDQTTPQSYLASGSNVMWDKDATNASVYDNGLFGIGRDDASGLSQIKSRGQTETNVIILEADGEGTNIAPAFEDMNNLEFLVIGDDAGGASWSTSGAPTGYSILDRRWLKQEQGNIGDISLSFDVADPDFDIPAAMGDGQYYFIYDTDNDGNLSDETPQALNDEGGDLWKTTVDFGAGGLFTLATTDKPALNSTNPGDNWPGVGIEKSPKMTFSRAVSGDTGNITIWKSADDSIFEIIPANSAKVTGNGTATITVNPDGIFASYTDYYITIDDDAFKDIDDNYFAGISNKESWNFRTKTFDEDFDGIDNSVEFAGPNSGDVNDDGMADDQQAYVASLVNTVTGEYASVAVPNTCTLGRTMSKSETSLTSDGDYSYPLGLLDFTVSCGSSGFTTTITQYYYNPPSGNFVLRKYVNGAYQTVDDATITATTISGQPVLKVEYDATDGGILDDDGIANGILVDPVGPAVLQAIPGAPNTGSARQLGLSVVLVWVVVLAIISSLASYLMLRSRP